MNSSGYTKGVGIFFLVAILGVGGFAFQKYLRSRPQGIPPVQRVANPARPRGPSFGSRGTDFADPRTTTLRYVSKYERSQGVQPNVTVGGRR
jgi:hypothetical protein